MKNYIDRFYNFKLRQEESKRLKPEYLIKENENLAYGKYTLRIPKDEKSEITKIQKLLEQVDKLYQKDMQEIPTIHFDQHLYTPLVVYAKGKDFIKSIPPKLNEGETEFVRILRDYLKANQAKLKQGEVFLLRNLSQRGVKFFQTSGFYPDFIMWKRDNSKQNIVFIDPKGIRNTGNFNDDKIQLHKTIKDIEKEINDPNLKLESFILSVSKYKNIKKNYENRRKEEFEDHNVLFLEDKEEACRKLFEKVK